MTLISVITPSYNSAKTIEACLESVQNQKDVNVEHLIIDGASTDNTLEILKKYRNVRYISEPDSGIYDALNKGLLLANGEFIAICHSNDIIFHPYAISKLVNTILENNCDFSYADCVYLSDNRLVRYYKSGELSRQRLSYGLAPAHPTLVMRRSIIDKVGYYSVKYAICGDFDYFTRLLDFDYSYIKEPLVAMSLGGASSFNFKNAWKLSIEKKEVLNKQNISTSLFKIFARYPYKKISSEFNKYLQVKKCRLF